MASMKEINLRIKSITGTRQITKAMELVAISKLNKAKERTEKCRPFYTELYRALCDISDASLDSDSIFSLGRPVKKSCYIVIAGDRGLAGGYNANLFRYFEKISDGKNVCVLPIGKRSLDYFIKRGTEIVSQDYAVCEDVDVGDCYEIGTALAGLYKEQAIDELYVVYTNFNSMLTQEPGDLKLLPLDESFSEGKQGESYILVEPNAEAVFDAIVPDAVAGLIWGAVSESYTAELAARRTAMESAGDNADEILADLKLQYNKARKGAITQQITELVSGSVSE